MSGLGPAPHAWVSRDSFFPPTICAGWSWAPRATKQNQIVWLVLLPPAKQHRCGTCTHTHTCMHAHTHTRTPHMHTRMHAHTCTEMDTHAPHARTCAHTCTHACTHVHHTHTCMHAHTEMDTHAPHTHVCTHMRHTRMQTCTHARTRTASLGFSSKCLRLRTDKQMSARGVPKLLRLDRISPRSHLRLPGGSSAGTPVSSNIRVYF